MKQLIILAIIAFAAWYGWHHYHDLLVHHPKHDVIIENHSGRGMERVRLAVGSQNFVKEDIPDNSSVTFAFWVSEDASFTLTWKWAGQDFDQHWSGGSVPRGPMVQVHHLNVDGDGGIIYTAENKLAQ
jgi:hypothetical protein